MKCHGFEGGIFWFVSVEPWRYFGLIVQQSADRRSKSTSFNTTSVSSIRVGLSSDILGIPAFSRV